ncbi:hypothetical protein K7B10_27445 [Streptomyces flavotricini]|uniref:Uncharacterized protein n=1 Tax=Streptomyces flavotricini TaxID=66888 RepID=A0ABS8EBA6_9ACTN|nr:hypothetical protein [Streptomyces flavotricini]MCC0098436.1 hypothetical protein [Streptomyces flavotricini]
MHLLLQATPERVVVLDAGELDNVVPLGLRKDAPGQTWCLGLGVTTADKVLEDLRTFLVR